jgi:polar amino acid transport system substrate-binding protein
MFNQPSPGMAGLLLGLTMIMTVPAAADALKDEIAPTGKLRVAIAISPAGGAFWSTKTETGFAGVPVDLGKAMAEQLGVPVEYVAHNNSGQIVDAASKGTWDITFLPKDPEREDRMSFGPIYKLRTRPTSSSRVHRSRISQHSISPASRSLRSTTRPRCAARLRI